MLVKGAPDVAVRSSFCQRHFKINYLFENIPWFYIQNHKYFLRRVFLTMSQYWFIYTWWRHQMETFSALLALCAGNSPVAVNYPHNGQWRGALMFSLICVWINDWVNNRESGDLRRHLGHYNVNVMQSFQEIFSHWGWGKWKNRPS